jgi:hypothetical protein
LQKLITLAAPLSNQSRTSNKGLLLPMSQCWFHYCWASHTITWPNLPLPTVTWMKKTTTIHGHLSLDTILILLSSQFRNLVHGSQFWSHVPTSLASNHSSLVRTSCHTCQSPENGSLANTTRLGSCRCRRHGMDGRWTSNM